MRELALHILDIVENAIEANARHIDLSIVENMNEDRLQIIVQDDGQGMDDERVKRVRDPFFTTRSTRHVGLGIPLFAAAAERCAGELSVQSAEGQGTTVAVTFQHSHIDRAPLGDITGTLMCILLRGERFDLRYTHRMIDGPSDQTFELDSSQLLCELGDIPLSHPTVRRWLSEFVTQGEQGLKENQCQS
jgi:anti-sigma regulatory factor (Ser/Thr protein kinase)